MCCSDSTTSLIKAAAIYILPDIIEEIRNYDREVFNSDRRFYRYLNDVGEYIEDTAEQEHAAEVKTVIDLLNEIENEALYQTLLTVDKHTLQIWDYRYREFSEVRDEMLNR